MGRRVREIEQGTGTLFVHRRSHLRIRMQATDAYDCNSTNDTDAATTLSRQQLRCGASGQQRLKVHAWREEFAHEVGVK
ncbi:hypothetical protein Plhal304r1_c045g0125321 [Plasmopara halstedii]